MGLARIDLIKIDVEGAEPMVLAGARASLARFRPKVIFECNAYLNAGGDATAATRAWDELDALGYRFQRLSKGVFSLIETPPADFCNVWRSTRRRRPGASSGFLRMGTMSAPRALTSVRTAGTGR